MVEQTKRPRLSVRMLGTVSVASGIASIVAPRRMAELYKLPRRPTLVRTLGVRDVIVGALLFSPPTTRAALLLRGLADMVDSGIVASQLLFCTRTFQEARGALSGAAMIGALAFELYRRTGPITRET